MIGDILMTQNEKEILYDEEGDFWYIEPRHSNTDDWTGPDLVECPADWVYNEEIPFDESDYYELERRIDLAGNDDIELVTNNFLKEKGILNIVLEKRSEF